MAPLFFYNLYGLDRKQVRFTVRVFNCPQPNLYTKPEVCIQTTDLIVDWIELPIDIGDIDC